MKKRLLSSIFHHNYKNAAGEKPSQFDMADCEFQRKAYARALLAIDDKGLQYELANKVFDEKLSVRETEKLVKDIKSPKKEKPKKEVVNNFLYKDLENRMKEVMGTKVNIASKGKGKGRIEIEYYSEDELERMFDMIMSLRKEV